ncbi:hypothetical protein [Chromobacterium violaceum]|nr:hypothetical protein [Chromobacterium violaceum]
MLPYKVAALVPSYSLSKAPAPLTLSASGVMLALVVAVLLLSV